MLAAARPLKVTNASESDTLSSGTSHHHSSFLQSMGAIETQKETIEALFTAHHDRVFRTAYRVTGSAADAEDVLQTVFLRVARGSETAGVAENPQAYFARAAINASLDLLRSRKRSRVVDVDNLENDANVTMPRQSPEAKQEARELKRLIRAAVSQLGPTAAQMFVLRYFEGYANGEIAKLMNTSPLVVGVTLHRARARLRKQIGNYLERHPAA